jgi:hypothetical protein
MSWLCVQLPISLVSCSSTQFTEKMDNPVGKTATNGMFLCNPTKTLVLIAAMVLWFLINV